MADNLFKKSFMGGYEKKEVEAKIAAYEAQAAEMSDKIATLTAETEAQREQIKMLEKERAFISDALLNAKKEAERMLTETNEQIAKLQTEAQDELTRLHTLADEERALIRSYQKSASEVLAAYKERIDNISI